MNQAPQGDLPTSKLFWLTDVQMARLRPFFPESHGKPRVDDRRVSSGMIFINRNGLRWCDAPKAVGPARTFCNRWQRWGDKGIFARMMDGLTSQMATPTTATIDVSRLAPSVRACLRKSLKAHCTATSLRVKKGGPKTDAAV